eukprot:10308092-Alexandrium_andersonii.AAC.1
MPCFRPCRRRRVCLTGRPVCRGWGCSTLRGLGPRSAVAHMAAATAAAVAGLSSAISAGAKAWSARPALPCRAHRTAAL